MNYVTAFLILLANFFLHSTILHKISILGVVPNTSLIIVVSFALLGGKKAGGIMGLITGLLQDVIFCDIIGINSLIYFLIGYFIGSINQNIFKENYMTSFVFTALSTFCFHIMYYILTYFLGFSINFLVQLKRVILIEIVYNSILAIFIFKQISKLYMTPTSMFNYPRRR